MATPLPPVCKCRHLRAGSLHHRKTDGRSHVCVEWTTAARERSLVVLRAQCPWRQLRFYSNKIVTDCLSDWIWSIWLRENRLANFSFVQLGLVDPREAELIPPCRRFDRADKESEAYSRKYSPTKSEMLTGASAFLKFVQWRSGPQACGHNKASLVWTSSARPAVLTLIYQL